ncbi:unnamed protein product [Fusarium equiseti]|uniref:MACPF-like domain-containing protein n=1 Tax=Fusarium equiseti TaxID=61235 RepID=A0A8J2NFK5_FUSEQ|nr:unnamed protein product [Fusarium equiseti]
MANTSPKFQIAIDGPAGTVFPSFPSTDLADGNLGTIILSNVRSKCNISNKLRFTADGKTLLDDQTTLEYYMTLTAEGNAILKPQAAQPAVTDPKDPNAAPVPAPVGPGVLTFMVKVLDSTPSAAPLQPIPETNAAMTKALEQIKQAKFLDPGTLPAFADSALAALAADQYKAAVGAGGYKEPAELTELQWDTVLKNNRALHAYYTDFDKGILVKAPRPAFRLRGVAPPGTPAATTETTDEAKGGDASQSSNTKLPEPPRYNPSIPPYYIYDTASVSVTETRQQQQRSLIKQGFNSTSVSGSLGGGAKIPLTVSAAFDQEHAWSKQDQGSTDVDSLAVTYNLPRVVIELDPESLELTPECSLDAKAASTADDVKAFHRKYGTVFPTSFTLGGYLYSTRNVTKDEQSSLDQVKDTTRKAAGLSIQTPVVSASIGVASANGTGTTTGDASLNQEARLTWDAHGGNTLLASNPTEWVSTVKDYRLWRLMDQQRVVQLDGLISDLDSVAYSNLMDPSSLSDTGKDPIKDLDFNARIRSIIADAALMSEDDSNVLIRQISDYYRNNQYDGPTASDVYNKFIAQNYPDSEAARIQAGVKFGGLTLDQIVYFGLFMASKGVLKFN